jgi:predicted nucleic acid-binding protein
MYLSTVVLYELIAANIDDSTLDLYAPWKKAYKDSDQLLTPTMSDWFECAKLIRNLLRGQKSKTKGYIQKITSAQQPQNDALIARTALLHNCFVFTNNIKDFEKFLPYMKGLIIVPSDYFFDT